MGGGCEGGGWEGWAGKNDFHTLFKNDPKIKI